jgi:hypothetical protein
MNHSQQPVEEGADRMQQVYISEPSPSPGLRHELSSDSYGFHNDGLGRSLGVVPPLQGVLCAACE